MLFLNITPQPPQIKWGFVCEVISIEFCQGWAVLLSPLISDLTFLRIYVFINFRERKKHWWKRSIYWLLPACPQVFLAFLQHVHNRVPRPRDTQRWAQHREVCCSQEVQLHQFGLKWASNGRHIHILCTAGLRAIHTGFWGFFFRNRLNLK